MKAEELRIGNYVEWEDDSKDLVIIKGINKPSKLGIWFVDIKYPKKNKVYSASLQEFKGVELTEECLLKFGFEKTEYEYLNYLKGSYVFSFKNNNIYFKNNIFYYEIAVNNCASYGDEPITKKIKHVHQLQNLYFALTGEELTIN